MKNKKSLVFLIIVAGILYTGSIKSRTSKSSSDDSFSSDVSEITGTLDDAIKGEKGIPNLFESWYTDFGELTSAQIKLKKAELKRKRKKKKTTINILPITRSSPFLDDFLDDDDVKAFKKYGY